MSIWILVSLVGCALPEGKRIEPPQKRQEVAAADAAVAETAEMKDAASGGETRSRDAGRPPAADSGIVEADDAGPDQPISRMPKRNGELCRGNEDCANANCKTSETGERRCFGSLGLDMLCTDHYECDGYTCVPRAPKSTTGVCVDKTMCPQSGTCFQDFGVAMCQLEQQCNASSGSFNECYRQACTLAGTTHAQCTAALPAQQSLNEGACCPPEGALHGSCDPRRQCGCGATENCSFDPIENQFVCSPAGDSQPGEICAPLACTRGYGCIGQTCKRQCEGPEANTCPANTACKPIRAMGKDTGGYYCTTACDPTDSSSTEPPFTGCPDTQRCNASPDGMTDCSLSGTLPLGASCDDGTGNAMVNGCEPGTVCIGKLVCAALCKVQGDDCPSGSICRSFGEPRFFAMDIEIGACDER